MAVLRATSDGVITIRPPRPADVPLLIAGRDRAFHRFLGPGDEHPQPTGVVTVGAAVVGWIDFDDIRAWRLPGEVNVGYNVFAAHRGFGYATRAQQLLMHHLAVDTDHSVATLLIDPTNLRSLALAHRARFVAHGDLDGNPYFKRAIPTHTLTDGVVTTRHVDARSAPTFGPQWTFAVDAGETMDIGTVVCDLAGSELPAGEACISSTIVPSHRGLGHGHRAIRLIRRFVRDNTAARRCHITIDDP